MILNLLAAAVLAALIISTAWRWSKHWAEDPTKLESWLEQFSPDSYRPMLRLSEPPHKGDTGFLAKQRGPEAATRYRALQRTMLREYLRGLSRDVNRLHVLASQKVLRPIPGDDDSSLSHVAEKLEFAFSIWTIELRLLLDTVVPCTVNLQPLLVTIDTLTERAREAARRRHEYRL